MPVSFEPEADTIYLSTSEGVTALRLRDVIQATARVIGDARPAVAPRPRSDDVERVLHAGPMTEGLLLGNYQSTEWSLASVRADASLLNSCRALVRRRVSPTVLNADDDMDLIARCKTAHLNGLKAVCLVGPSVSWATHERLQRNGVIVGRVPFSAEGATEAYAIRAAARERARAPLNRVAWFIHAEADPFTLSLRYKLEAAIKSRLRVHGFDAIDLTRETRLPRQQPGLVFLFTHGADYPNAGAPRVAWGPALDAVKEACSAGAVVVHLGCNGAGTVGGGRYAMVAQQLGLRVPSTEEDTVNSYGLTCLEQGATGVVAHVDSTWSTAFATATPWVDFVDWVASGRGALGHALESMVVEAQRAGSAAFEAHMSGDPKQAGLNWLRHMDLLGFVLLGDPSAYCVWR